MRRALWLLLLPANSLGLIHGGSGSWGASPTRARRRQKTARLFSAASSDRKSKFWSEVDTLLSRAEDAGREVGRVRRFAEYASFARALPAEATGGSAAVPLHQPSEEYVEGLAARPFWDTGDFAWAAPLEAASGEIAAELAAILKADRSDIALAGDSAYQSTMMGGGWSAIRLQRLGVWNEDVCAAFPRTTAALRSLDPPLPFAMRGVMFARQVPNTGVAPHSDARNFVLTAHLGLRVPSRESGADCWIRVATERRRWEEGKLLVIDTSFEHETANVNAKNDADEPRDVLIIDFWHPELTLAERDALSELYALRNAYDASFYAAAPPKVETETNDLMGFLRKAQSALGISSASSD